MPHRQFSSVNVKILSAVFLLITAVAQFIWLFFDKDYPFAISLADAFGSYAALFATFLFTTYGMRFNLPSSTPYTIILIESAILALVWAYILQWIFTWLFNNNEYTLFWQDSIYIRAFLGWILLSGFCVINYLAQQILLENESKEQLLHNEQLKKDAELYKLRQQLHPHFIFNSLNSINALIGREPQQARDMVQHLSEFLRHTLKKEDNDFIPFSEEMEDMRLYLSIEKVRFGHRLIINEHIADECNYYKIPPFILQPLLENAIKFGLYGTIGTVTIEIEAKNENSYIHFSIKNPYDATAVLPSGTGFGIGSVRRRLYLLFARNDLLRIEKTDGDMDDLKYFTAHISLPIIHSNNEDNHN